MIHSKQFTCILDTNILYPLTLRDIIFWFAYHDLCTIKWSRHIIAEWVDVMERHNVAPEEISKRINYPNKAFPDAQVENYEQLIPSLELPDEKDRHILAAAIKCNADVIVTHNLKDFPGEYLKLFNLSASSPDDFLKDLIDLNNETAKKAFLEMVSIRKNPPVTAIKMLESLENNKLKNTAYYLKSLI